jgi:chromatin segregation and condensation protein Rec8/ScpA/Scc1 (kleisin family)
LRDKPDARESRSRDFDGEDFADEGKWNARTLQVLNILRDQLKQSDEVSFRELSAGVTKRTAATCFLEVLQLKTWDIIDAVQEHSLGDIMITPKVKSCLGTPEFAAHS